MTERTREELIKIVENNSGVAEVLLKGDFESLPWGTRVTLLFDKLTEDQNQNLMVNLDLELNEKFGYANSDYQINVSVLEFSDIINKDEFYNISGDIVYNRGVWFI